ncbi:MAG TPA: hypothetical protein VED40_06885 [Azospirillaceae bacterium]|nr:hypothetical protein [Azospirillaceae bacterium]
MSIPTMLPLLMLVLAAPAASAQGAPSQGAQAVRPGMQQQGQQPGVQQPAQPGNEANLGVQTPDPGFSLDVAGSIGDTGEEQLAEAVSQALPDDLTDPARNFKTKTANAGDYRLVMVFHGDAQLPADTLCVQAKQAEEMNAPEPAVTAEPAQPRLDATTHVTAAFCDGEKTLSAANDRMTGEVVPGQASFRFLVADIAKQLFPSGFDVLPGTEGATATTRTQP